MPSRSLSRLAHRLLVAVLAVLTSVAALPAAAQVAIYERVEVDPASASSARAMSSVVLSIDTLTAPIRYNEIVQLPLSLSDETWTSCTNGNCYWYYDAALEGFGWGTDGILGYKSRYLEYHNGCVPLEGCLVRSDTLRGRGWDEWLYYQAGTHFFNPAPIFGYIWDYRSQGAELDIPIPVDVMVTAFYKSLPTATPEYTNTVVSTINVLPPWLEESLQVDTVALGDRFTVDASARDAEGLVEVFDGRAIEVGVYAAWTHPDDPEPWYFYEGDGGTIENTRTGESSYDYLTVTYGDLRDGHVVYIAPTSFRPNPPAARRAERRGADARRAVFERRATIMRERLAARGLAVAEVDQRVLQARTRWEAGLGRQAEGARVAAASGGPEALYSVSFDFWDFDYIYEYTDEVVVTGPRVDLVADSDNDGDLDGSDEAAEYDDDRVGALLALNDDDDDGDGVPDLDGPGGFDDDDLEPIELRGSINETAQVVLEAVEGAELVRVWADRSKGTEIALPHTLPASALPMTYFVEGVAWDTTATVLRLAYEETPGVVSDVDTLRVYSGPLVVDADSEYEAGEPGYVAVGGLPAGTPVRFDVYRDGALAETVEAEVDGFLAGIPLPYETVAGTVFSVEATADAGAVVLESNDVTVTPGSVATVELEWENAGPPVARLASGTVSDVSVPSDGHRTFSARAVVKDQFVNVLEGAPVTWLLSGFGALVASDEAVGPDGTVRTFVRVGDVPDRDQVLGVAVGGQTSSVRRTAYNAPIDISVVAQRVAAPLGPTDSVRVEATLRMPDGAPVPAGTRVEWHTGKGAFGAEATETDGNGQAVQYLDLSETERGAAPGAAAVAVSSGRNANHVQFDFQRDLSCFRVEVDDPVLAGDYAFDPTAGSGGRLASGASSVAGATGIALVEQFDGSTLPYTYHTATTVRVVGAPANSDVTVRIVGPSDLLGVATGTAGALVPVTPDETGNGYTLTISTDGTGAADLVVYSKGTFDDAYRSTSGLPGADDAAMAAFTVEAEVVGSTSGRRASGSCGTVAGARVVLTPANTWAWLVDFVQKFVVGAITGEGESAGAVSGDLVLGSLPITGIFTDGRDVIKELFRAASGGKPNWAVFAFAAAGLATEFPIFKVLGLDAALNACKIAAKQMGAALAESFARYVVDGIRRVVDQTGTGGRLRRLVEDCGTGSSGLRVRSGATARLASGNLACATARFITDADYGLAPHPTYGSYKQVVDAAGDAGRNHAFPGLAPFHEVLGEAAGSPEEFLRLVLDVPAEVGIAPAVLSRRLTQLGNSLESIRTGRKVPGTTPGSFLAEADLDLISTFGKQETLVRLTLANTVNGHVGDGLVGAYVRTLQRTADLPVGSAERATMEQALARLDEVAHVDGAWDFINVRGVDNFQTHKSMNELAASETILQTGQYGVPVRRDYKIGDDPSKADIDWESFNEATGERFFIQVKAGEKVPGVDGTASAMGPLAKSGTNELINETIPNLARDIPSGGIPVLMVRREFDGVNDGPMRQVREACAEHGVRIDFFDAVDTYPASPR